MNRIRHEIEFRVDLHRIVADDIEGDWARRTDPAILTKDGKQFIAYVENVPNGLQAEVVYEYRSPVAGPFPIMRSLF